MNIVINFGKIFSGQESNVFCSWTKICKCEQIVDKFSALPYNDGEK